MRSCSRVSWHWGGWDRCCIWWWWLTSQCEGAVGPYFHICIYLYFACLPVVICFHFQAVYLKSHCTDWRTVWRASIKKHLTFCLFCTTSCSSVVKGKSHVPSSKKTPQNSQLGGQCKRKWRAHIGPGFHLPAAGAAGPGWSGRVECLSPEPKKRSILKRGGKLKKFWGNFLIF